MADKQKILELDIDIESILSKSVQLKATLDQLRQKQDDLKKSGDTSSQTFVKNAALISKVSSEYNKNQQQLSNLVTGGSTFISVQEKMNFAIDKEIVSIAAARQNNTELLKVRNELNLKTEAGAKAAELINSKLDANNKFIKENVSAYEKQKINIGNYTESIKEAFNQSGLMTGGLGDLARAGSAVSGVFGLLKDDFSASWSMMKNAAKGTDDLAGSQKALAIATNFGTGAMRIFTLALAATGIGLIIAAIALLIGYLKTFNPIVDKVEQGLAAVGAVVKVVQQALVALFTLDFGFFDGLGEKMSEAASAAVELKKAQQDLEDAMKSQEVQTARNRAEINRLNIQAKDRTKTEEERLALLAKSSQLEDQDYAQRRKNANEQLRIAQQQIINAADLSESEANELRKRGLDYKEYVEKKTNDADEFFDRLKDAQLAQVELDNEFYANQEKLINKQNKLLEDQEAKKAKAKEEAEKAAKRAQELRQKSLDDAVAKSKAELDLFISQQGYRAKSLQDDLAVAEKIRDKKLEIAKKEYDASKKSATDQLKLLTDQNNAKQEFLKKQADATISNAQRELDSYLQSNQSKIDKEKFFTEMALSEEQRRIDLISEKRRQFEALRLEQGIIDEQTYQDNITKIQNETRQQREDAQKNRDTAEKERRKIDLENQQIIDEQMFADSLAVQLARLQIQKQQEIDEAEKTGASIKLINEKYANAEKLLRINVELSRLATTSDTLNKVSGLLKQNTLVAKAVGIAESTINTYAAIAGQLKAFAGVPIPGYAIAQAIATGAVGFAQVAKISGIKLAKGGEFLDYRSDGKGALLRGPGTGTSDSMNAFLSNGESVINAKSTAMFKPLLSAINVAGGGVAFAKGGIPYPSMVTNTFSTSNQTFSGPLFDYDLLAAKIAQANSTLPAPKMAFDDFHNENQKYLDVKNGASL